MSVPLDGADALQLIWYYDLIPNPGCCPRRSDGFTQNHWPDTPQVGSLTSSAQHPNQIQPSIPCFLRDEKAELLTVL